MIQGIDVSKYQGEIRWEEVKKAGIEFVMIRTTLRRTDDILATDPLAIANITGAQRAGIYAGAYHYCRAKTTEQAIEEAKYFLSVIKSYQLEYPVVLDLEDTTLTSLGKSKLTQIAEAFLQTVQDAGYYVMLYSNKYWLTSLLDMEKLRKFDVWLAQYPAATYTGPFGMWQYSPTGEVAGISNHVDMDYAYQDYAQIIKQAGLGGFPKPDTPETPVEPPKPEEPDLPTPPDIPEVPPVPENPDAEGLLAWLGTLLEKVGNMLSLGVNAIKKFFAKKKNRS